MRGCQPLLRLLLLQVNSVMVAGHDTTSFCLTSTLYWVAQNPAVKQQLFAEIDRFGRHRKVTAADMGQFPYLEVSVCMWTLQCLSTPPPSGSFSVTAHA